MPPASTSPYVRINLRTSPEAQALIERAAALTGTTVAAFVLHHAYEAAHRVVSDHDWQVLLDQDRDAFMAVLDSLVEPAQTLAAQPPH